ncbi:MAG TPA: class I SAM-dependent methyltransferase [Patescibacteria group bacterium]|nr:class I SAM-dependent methyltransferase [Patescibacteria group bacterium]
MAMSDIPNKAALDYFNDRADALAAQYNALDRAKVHADLLENMPAGEALQVLDIGAGSGADAALFARLGHHVVAAEPADKLRALGEKIFDDNRIEWNADVLPELQMSSLRAPFDIITATGVLQYMDEEARAKSLKKIFSLVAPGGIVEIQYPTPSSREHQFTIRPDEMRDIVRAYNEASPANPQFDVIIDKSVPDHTGRKALDGSDLFFKTMLLRRIRQPQNNSQIQQHGC